MGRNTGDGVLLKALGGVQMGPPRKGPCQYLFNLVCICPAYYKDPVVKRKQDNLWYHRLSRADRERHEILGVTKGTQVLDENLECQC